MPGAGGAITDDRLTFGVFELVPARHELRRGGARVRLQEKPFEVLLALVERPGEEVTRAELRQRLWPGEQFHDFEAGINTAVRKLREALGDSPNGSRYIETIPRRGYRFVAPVTVVRGTAPAAAPTPPAVEGGAAPDGVATVAPARPWLRPRALLVLALALLVLTAVAVRRERADRREARLQPPRSIAVLPLSDQSSSPAPWFTDGMTEALIAELAKIDSLSVISHTSAMAFRQQPRRLPEIARELGVEAILEGAIRREGDRFRLTVRLLDARSDRHLWAEIYDREVGDSLRLQTELARAVAERVELELTPADARRLAARRQVDARAYDAYLRGRYFWNQRSAAGFEKALEHFARAVELDPGYAAAHSGLADTYGLIALSGYDLLPAREAMPRARAEAQRALALDDSLAEAHASLAWVSFTWDWDFALAEREFRRAIDLNPGYATAHQWYSNFLCAAGRLDEATAHIERALALDPLSRVINEEASWPPYYRGEYERAIAQLRRTLELDPDYAIGHQDLALALVRLGRLDEAAAELEEVARLTGGGTAARAYLGYVLALREDREGARRVLAELARRATTGHVAAHEAALVHTALGDRDEAFAALDRAFDERSDMLLYLAVEPLWEPLRGDPRFAELVRRVGIQRAD